MGMLMYRFDKKIWKSSDQNSVLAHNTIHVWAANLDEPPLKITALQALLSADELERSKRYAQAKLQQRFITGRGILRVLLSRYTGITAESLEFVYGAYGKPALAESSGAHKILFNLTHSAQLAVYAFALQTPLGVDIESVQALSDMWRVAQRFFAAQELQALMALPEDQQLGGFYRCWTRKEAFIKASGKGLTQALDEFVVSVEAEKPAALLHLKQDGLAPRQWSLVALPLPQAFEGALAFRSTKHTLSYWLL